MSKTASIPAEFLPRHEFVRNLVVVNGPVLQLFQGEGRVNEFYLRHLCWREGRDVRWFLFRVTALDLYSLLANRIGLREVITRRMSGGYGWYVSYVSGELRCVELALELDESFLPESDEPLGDLLESDGEFTVFTGPDIEKEDLFPHLRRFRALYSYLALARLDGHIPRHELTQGFSVIHLRRDAMQELPPRARTRVVALAMSSPGFVQLQGDHEVVRELVQMVETTRARRTDLNIALKSLSGFLSEHNLNNKDAQPDAQQTNFLETGANNILRSIDQDHRWNWILKETETIFYAVKFVQAFAREALRVADAVDQNVYGLPVIVEYTA